MSKKYANRKVLKPSVLRPVVKGLFLLAIVVSLVVLGGWGSYSSFGPQTIAAICPLGALESLFGSWAFVPRLLIALLVTLLVIFVVGRAFCAWVCPVPPISRFLSSKKRLAQDKQENDQAGALALARWQARGTTQSAGCQGCAVNSEGDGIGSVGGKTSVAHQTKPFHLDSRHAVLAGALGSSFIFGFPVFCLVCPIGLSIATAVLLVRLVGFNEPSWGLIAFPLIVVVELVFARNFCMKLCPMAALMSLVGRLNRTFRPQADTSLCLRTQAGEMCHACSSVCPVHIDPRSDLGVMPKSECIRCGRCAEVCPAGAIDFPLIAGKSQKK